MVINRFLVWWFYWVLDVWCNWCGVGVLVGVLVVVEFFGRVFVVIGGGCSLVVCVFCCWFVLFIRVFWGCGCVWVWFFWFWCRFFSVVVILGLLDWVFIVWVDCGYGWGNVGVVWCWRWRISIWVIGCLSVLVFFWILVCCGRIFCIVCCCRNLWFVWFWYGCISCGWIGWFCYWLVGVRCSVGNIIGFVCGCLVWVVWWFGRFEGWGVGWCVWLCCFCLLCCVFWRELLFCVWCVLFSFVVLLVFVVGGIVCGNSGVDLICWVYFFVWDWIVCLGLVCCWVVFVLVFCCVDWVSCDWCGLRYCYRSLCVVFYVMLKYCEC